MPKDLLPLNESERFQLNRLLDRSGQSLAQAEAQRARERDQEARLRARQDKLAREEAQLSRRLAQLRVDLDVVSSQIYQIAPHATAFRFVHERLQQLGTLLPKQSFFNSSRDNMDAEAIQLLAEIGLAMHRESTRPKKGAKSLREKMESVAINIGPDAPGAGAPSDDKAAMAQAIIRAGRRRRNEEP